MYISIYFDKNKPDRVLGSIDSVFLPQKDDLGYRIINKPKTNNFNFSNEDFVFDKEKKMIVSERYNRQFTVDDFVELIIRNHLYNRRRLAHLKYFLKGRLFVFLIWLSGNSEKNVMLEQFTHESSRVTKNNLNIDVVEPFFNYFHIYKNLLMVYIFFIILVVAVVDKNDIVTRIGLSNQHIYLFLLSVLGLFIAENTSSYLKKIMNSFVSDRSGVLQKLHLERYGFGDEFDLIIPKHLGV